MTPSDIRTILVAHAAWLRDNTDGKRADLSGAYLRGGVNLAGADLRYADLRDANLAGATLRGADLNCAKLNCAKLTGANLRGATLRDANLRDADLRCAKLSGAILTGADLTGATMPDGRTWEEYSADHLAGICDDPKVRARAIAAWGGRTWDDCPMHAALGVDGLRAITDAELRLRVGAWVALYDADLLPRPG